MQNFFVAVLSVATMSACTSGKSDSGAGGPAKLSPEQEQALQNWIQAPIKSCEAIEVIGGGASQFDDQFPTPFGAAATADAQFGARPVGRDAIKKGIDLSVLAAKTKGSLWIGDRSGLRDFAVLSGGSTPFTSGVAESKFEQSIEINGQAQSVKVETKSSGYDCVVTVNGVERAKVRIAQNVEVGLAGGKSWQVAESRQRRDQAITRHGTVVEFQARQLLTPLLKGLQVPAIRTQALATLGFTQTEAETYFPLANSRRPAEIALESLTGGRLILSDASRFLLTGQDVALVSGATPTRDLSFVILMGTEKSSIGGQDFASGNQGVMALKRVLRLREESPAGVAELVYQDTGFGDTRLEPSGPQVADRCVLDRSEDEYALYNARMLTTRQARIASFGTVYSPCFVFDGEVSDRAATNGIMLKVLNRLFANVGINSLGERFEFGDWAQALVQQVDFNLKDAKRPGIAQSGGTVLSAIDANIDYARQGLQTGSLALTDSRRRNLAELILRMAEYEIQDPRESRTRKLTNTLARLFVTLEAAFDLPLIELVRIAERDLSRALSLANVALGLAPSYLNFAKEAFVEAQSIDYATYLRNVHARLFELVPSERELQEWTLRFRNLRNELQKYSSLKGQSGALVDALLTSSIASTDYPVWIQAAGNLANGSTELLGEIVEAIRTGGANSTIRDWALKLSAADQAGIATYLAEAKKQGLERQAMDKIRALVRALAPQGAFARLPQFATRASAFYQAEVNRAQGSVRDTFFESRAKEIAGRILIEEFDDADLLALESFAKIAGSDMMCDGRMTISLRLECVGLERFRKTGTGILQTKYQGRYKGLSDRMNVWLNQLVPATDFMSIRRNLKAGMFPSFGSAIWESCDATSFQTKFQALDQAMGRYLVAIGDFITRSRIEREVSAALDSRCQ